MLLFPNGSCIEENHRTSLHCFRDAKVLYMLYVLLQNVWNHNKIIFLKKDTKYTHPKKVFKKNSCTKLF